MLNLQIGIIKDFHKQGFLIKPQMESAINILIKEYRKANEAAGRAVKPSALLAHAAGVTA